MKETIQIAVRGMLENRRPIFDREGVLQSGTKQTGFFQEFQVQYLVGIGMFGCWMLAASCGQGRESLVWTAAVLAGVPERKRNTPKDSNLRSSSKPFPSVTLTAINSLLFYFFILILKKTK